MAMEEDIRRISPDACCGCEACANACPVNAVSMEEGKERFLFPTIDQEACIHCGRCLKACPVSREAGQRPLKNLSAPRAWAAAAGDQVRMQTSSGGIFRVLAERTAAAGGVVYGAAWGRDGEGRLLVEHVRLTEIGELFGLSGSKYVQSRIRTAYRQVREDLRAGRQVLFSGTPCQNAGLRRYLGREWEGLLLADLVCHGVPSQALFQKYLSDVFLKAYGRAPRAVDFRLKKYGQSCSRGIVTMEGGKKRVISRDTDPFEQGFHGSLFLRRSCYACPFAAPPRPGDLTLGDFWGLEAWSPKLCDPRGISVVLANSPKGERALEAVSGELALFQEAPLEAAVRRNRFRKNVSRPKERERCLELMERMDFQDAVYAAQRGTDQGRGGMKKRLRRWLIFWETYLPEPVWTGLRRLAVKAAGLRKQ